MSVWERFYEYWNSEQGCRDMAITPVILTCIEIVAVAVWWLP